ncbi:MAG: hypothetical protein OEY38_24750, partial [Gammaproteobacteria bacterium]|nr:hypothetical protein [Gammaproteobacteria bacterium]
YATAMLKQSRILTIDNVTGWKLRPNLDVTRMNSNSHPWRIVTDQNGNRFIKPIKFQHAKLLIIGDSFVFGEGINIEERFDNKIELNNRSIINTGVMGYGPLQQFLASRQYLEQLTEKDFVLIVTYVNDFYDVQYKFHSGRSKPWPTLNTNQFEIHYPNIDWWQRLRNKSYLLAKLHTIVNTMPTLPQINIEYSIELYTRVIEEILDTKKERNFGLAIMLHGVPVLNNETIEQTITQGVKQFCTSRSVNCLFFDEHINYEKNQEFFLNDGHWNVNGHEAVASFLNQKLFGSLK